MTQPTALSNMSTTPPVRAGTGWRSTRTPSAALTRSWRVAETESPTGLSGSLFRRSYWTGRWRTVRCLWTWVEVVDTIFSGSRSCFRQRPEGWCWRTCRLLSKISRALMAGFGESSMTFSSHNPYKVGHAFYYFSVFLHPLRAMTDRYYLP